MRIEKIKTGELFLGDKSINGFKTNKSILGIEGSKTGRVARKFNNDQAYLYIHTLENGHPVVYQFVGNIVDNGYTFHRSNSKGPIPFMSYADSGKRVIKQLAKNRNSAKNYYGSEVFENKDKQYFNFHSNKILVGKSLRRKLPDAGKFTVLPGYSSPTEWYYCSISNDRTGHIFKVKYNTTKVEQVNQGYVLHTKVNGIENGDYMIENKNIIARFWHPDSKDIAVGKTKSYAKSLLDEHKIK